MMNKHDPKPKSTHAQLCRHIQGRCISFCTNRRDDVSCMQATGNKPSSRGSHCSRFRRQWVAFMCPQWEEASNNTNISGVDILYVVHDTAVHNYYGVGTHYLCEENDWECTAGHIQEASLGYSALFGPYVQLKGVKVIRDTSSLNFPTAADPSAKCSDT